MPTNKKKAVVKKTVLKAVKAGEKAFTAELTKKMGKKAKKKKPKTKGKMGRPKAELDYDILESLVSVFCTGEECASVLRIDYDTLVKHIKDDYGLTFSEYYKKRSGTGRASLRRRQFQMAMTNPTLSIWMGKQFLGQSDKTEATTNHKHVHFFQNVVRKSKQRHFNRMQVTTEN